MSDEKNETPNGIPFSRLEAPNEGCAPQASVNRRRGRMTSVLFVCGMNAIRSPMAEAIARKVLPATIYVASAGVRSGERDPFVDAVLAEKGLDLGDRLPQRFEDLADSFFDLIVTMTPEAHEAALDASGTASVGIEFWNIPDPSTVAGSRQQVLDAYRDVYTRIDDCIRERLLS